MNKINKILLSLVCLAGMGAGAGVNQVQEVGLGVDNKADVKRAYSNSKNLVLPTSISQFVEFYPKPSYLGYGWVVSGGIASASNGVLTFNSEMTTCFNSLNSRIANNPAVGYVCFRFLFGVTADQGSTGTPFPGRDNDDESFKVTDNYYSFITEVENVNTLEKCKEYIQNQASFLGSSCNGAFGLSFATVNHANTLVDGKTQSVYYYVPNVPTIADVLSNVSAVDLFGKEVAVNCSDSEKAHYTGKIGVSDVKVSATDSYGQTATATLNIHIIDNGKPVIALASGKNLSFVSGSSSLKVADLPSYFSITDLGTSFGGTIGTPSYTYDGASFADKTFGASDFGTHTVGVTVADSSGNSATANFSLSVTDGTAPVITRRDSSDVSTVIKVGVSKTFSLTKAEFLQIFKAIDNIDGDLSASLDVEGDYIGNKVGNYPVKVVCFDKSGNKGSVTATVQVIADLPPVFILSDTLVQATTAQSLSTSDLASVVTNGILSRSTVTACSVNAGSYIGNENVAGDYTITYSATVSSGVKSLVRNASNDVAGSFILRVVKSTGEAQTKDNAHWYDSIVEFFHKLVNWFRGVFTKFKFDCFITDDEWSTRFSA